MKFNVGDLVVLKSGSMRMVVANAHDDDSISTVWCHEGVIGRDRFAAVLLNKWEHRDEDARGARPERAAARPPRPDREGGSRPRGGEERGGHKPREREEERPKTGWHGKPREKKYFRKED